MESLGALGITTRNVKKANNCARGLRLSFHLTQPSIILIFDYKYVITPLYTGGASFC